MPCVIVGGSRAAALIWIKRFNLGRVQGCSIDTSSQEWDTAMIPPQQTDLGRRVIYRPPEAGHRYGIIAAIYPRCVFVRFDHQHFSRPVNAAYLEFANRPAEAVPRSDRRKASSNRSPGLHSEHIKADPSPG